MLLCGTLRSWLIVMVSIVLAVSLPVLAQRTNGDIAGDVTDSSGAVVPNVTVTAKNVGTGLERTATTTSTGSYRITELPIGDYKVTVSAAGFKTVVQDAQVVAGGVIHADFKLTVGERTETVEVQGSAPLIDLSPNQNNYVDQQKIEEVPLNGRDFNSLLAITPGVQRAPGGGFLAVSINGARTTSNNYFIDGLYNNDRYYGDSAINQTGILGIPAVTFPPDAIEELSVQQTPAAEFGVKGGAPILLNMKSGTNAWHGGATWINHSGFGDANNYFANHNDCSQPGQCQRTPIHNNQFHGNIGGPIVKDKAFFFLFYEGQRNKSIAIKNRAVPTPQEIADAEADIAANGLTIDPVGQTLLNYFPTDPSGSFTQQTPSTASNNEFGVKFDYKFNTNHSVAVRYIFGDSLQSGPPFAGLPPNPAFAQDLFNSVAPSRAQMAGVSWTWNISNNKILESRLGFTRFSQILDVGNKIDPKSLGIDTGPLSPADFGVPYVYMYHLGYGGYIGGVQGYPITTRPDQTWDWSEHLSWVKGNHNIKLGGNFQRAYTNSLRNFGRTGLAVGYFAYYTASPYYGGNGYLNGDPVENDIEELLLGKADFANRSFGDTHRHIYQNSVGFYAQDDWKIKPRFTLNYGLRYEVNGTVRDTNNLEANFVPGRGLVQVGQGIDSIHNVDYRNFGPRVGFAWDILGNGKVALRGGYSLTFDVANFASLAAPYSFARARAGVFTEPNLGFFQVANLSDVAAGTNTAYPLPTDPAATCYDPIAGVGDYICFNSATNGPLYGSNPNPQPPFNAFSVPSDLKTPRYHNYNLSMQSELFQNNVLTVTYSGQRGRDLLDFYDLNASPLGSPCSSAAGCDSFRPLATAFSDLRHVIRIGNFADSQYDSLQMSYNQRGWHGLDTQYNLTWSKCFDLSSVNRGGQGNYPQISNDGTGQPNFKEARGFCDHDVRLNFNVGGVYSIPGIHALGERLGNGWQISTIYTAIGGRPFSVFKNGGTDPSGQGLTGASIRADYDGSPIVYNTRNPDAYVANIPDQFTVPNDGFVGNSRRNMLRGPGLSQWDISLIKNTKINERVNFQIRWEVFNVLNRANFALSGLDNTAGASTFGQIVQTPDVASGNPVIAQGGPRNMNFGLKLIF